MKRQVQAKALPETIQADQSKYGESRTNEGNPRVRTNKDIEKNRFKPARDRKANGDSAFQDRVSTVSVK